MAAPLSKNWRKFPPLATQIDWSNPLTRNLGRVITPSSGVIDVVTRQISTVNGTVTRTPSGFKAGSATGNRILLLDFPASQYTCLAIAHAYTGTGGKILIGRTSGSTLFDQNYVLYLSNGVTPVIQHKQAADNAYKGIGSATNAPINSASVIVGTYDGTNQKIYLNGQLGNTGAATTPVVSFAGVGTQLLSADAVTATQGYEGQGLLLAAIWNRALTDAEVAEVSENPWQLFRPQSAPVIFFGPAIGTDALTANDLQSLSQLSTPALGQKHALLANDLQSTSSVQTVALGQKHVLLANDLESTSSVQTVALGQKHVLLANDLESLSQLSQPALTSSGGLLANDLESISSVQTVALGQKHNLLANDLESTSSVQTIILSQKHVLLANDLQNLSQISSPAIGGGGAFALLANDLESATQLSISVLRQKRQVNYATSVTIASLNGVTFYHNGGKWYGY